MEQVDVVVVGAGPAGCAAAIELRRAGRSVAVVDKATFPRDKICGDGLTTGALRRFEHLGLDPAAIPSWQQVRDVTICGPYGRRLDGSLPSGPGTYAAVATRRDLDAAMVDLARKEGAVVRQGTSMVGISVDTDGVTVGTDPAGDLRAGYVVAADGMWSPTRKALGIGPAGYKGDWHAFRQYVGGVTGPAADRLVVFFEEDFLPGYFWSFPLPGGRANIGFGIQRGGAHTTRDMAALWRDLLARPHVREVLGPDVAPLEPHRAWPIPCRTGDLPLAHGRVLFAGDAAAVCDVMTGEGIGQALQTGMMTAHHVNSSWADPERVAAGYETSVLAELGTDHRMSSLLIRALQHRKGAAYALDVAGLTDWTRRNFLRWLFEDSPRGIAYRPSLWRRGALSGPGAYR